MNPSEKAFPSRTAFPYRKFLNIAVSLGKFSQSDNQIIFHLSFCPDFPKRRCRRPRTAAPKRCFRGKITIDPL